MGSWVILSDVSIGETLAEARRRAGLTIAEVSTRTRIRQTLIRDIEHDEFDGCGGDFYARGHIRAIAAAVGADPEALIGEYDAAHPAGRPVTLDDLPGPSPAPRGRGQRRGSCLIAVMMVVGIAVVGFVAIRLTPGGGSPRLSASASSSPAPSRTRAPSPGASAPARSPAPSQRQQPSPARSAPRSVPPPVPVTQLTPVSAAAFGPSGTSDGDNPQNAGLALSGDPATPWHTDWYTTARFGNLQAGTGLLVDLGRTVTATGVTIRLGDAPGADLQVRAGTAPAGLRVVASAAGAGGTVRLRLAARPRVRYLLIWFTLLPPDGSGTYQADISGVRVAAVK